MEPEGTVGDAVIGSIYPTVGSQHAEYLASIQVRGNISGKSFTFLIDTGSTHFYIPCSSSRCKVYAEKLQELWKVQNG